MALLYAGYRDVDLIVIGRENGRGYVIQVVRVESALRPCRTYVDLELYSRWEVFHVSVSHIEPRLSGEAI